MSSLDIVSHQSPFRNHLGVPVAHLLYPGRIQNKNIVRFWNANRFEISWKDQFQFPKIRQRRATVIVDGQRTSINAVATVEPDVLVQKDEMHTHDLGSQFGQLLVTSEESTSELDERERLRRMKISKANKGNIPWNKGRKHSPETLQRIRERTRLAMQDPKVKMKLVNIGHAQSEETRLKIGIGVREGWQKRREKLIVQETCCLEWQNAIAETSREGYGDEEELQWDSYKILDKQLRKEWLESVEKRKSMPRAKGSKRAPKSLEQRRKISEAISAKWADPGYRERVCSALSKYHGITVGVERKARKKSAADVQKSERDNVRRKKESENLKFEIKMDKKAILKKKGPTYRDPMASSKLEMIKQIRVQRIEMENRKREATERAKLLIAEAEKAAKALEVAALKSPVARASLLETRKLIAEATRSIEKIENGELPTEDNRASFNPESAGIHANGYYDKTIHNSLQTIRQDASADVPHVNGSCQLASVESSETDFQFDEFTVQDTLKGNLPSCISEELEANFERVYDEFILPLLVNHASDRQDTEATSSCLQDLDKTSSSSVSKELDTELPVLQQQNHHVCADDNLNIKPRSTSSVSPAKTKKKWVCGRLVEVVD